MKFRKRAGIEPIISHLKSDFRLSRNFLAGIHGDRHNLMMSVSAFNFRKWIAKYEKVVKNWLHSWIDQLAVTYNIIFDPWLKLTF